MRNRVRRGHGRGNFLRTIGWAAKSLPHRLIGLAVFVLDASANDGGGAPPPSRSSRLLCGGSGNFCGLGRFLRWLGRYGCGLCFSVRLVIGLSVLRRGKLLEGHGMSLSFAAEIIFNLYRVSPLKIKYK